MSWLKQYEASLASIILVLISGFIKTDNKKSQMLNSIYHIKQKSHIIITVKFTVSLIPEIKMHNTLVYYDC